MKQVVSLVIAAAAALGLAACTDDAQVVNENITKAADNFEVMRRVVMFNGITDEYLLVVEGACSIKDQETQLEVICKVEDGKYKKHFLGLSDNVSYFIEQGEPVKASAYHYRVTFKPQTILPDPDFRGSADADELPQSQD